MSWLEELLLELDLEALCQRVISWFFSLLLIPHYIYKGYIFQNTVCIRIHGSRQHCNRIRISCRGRKEKNEIRRWLNTNITTATQLTQGCKSNRYENQIGNSVNKGLISAPFPHPLPGRTDVWMSAESIQAKPPRTTRKPSADSRLGFQAPHLQLCDIGRKHRGLVHPTAGRGSQDKGYPLPGCLLS